MDDKLEEAILRALRAAGSPLGATEVRVCTMLDDPPLAATKAQVAKALKGLVASGKVTRKGYGRGTSYSPSRPSMQARASGLDDRELEIDLPLEEIEVNSEEIL